MYYVIGSDSTLELASHIGGTSCRASRWSSNYAIVKVEHPQQSARRIRVPVAFGPPVEQGIGAKR